MSWQKYWGRTLLDYYLIQEKNPLSLCPSGALDGFTMAFCDSIFLIEVASGKASLSLGLIDTHTNHTLATLGGSDKFHDCLVRRGHSRENRRQFIEKIHMHDGHDSKNTENGYQIPFRRSSLLSFHFHFIHLLFHILLDEFRVPVDQGLFYRYKGGWLYFVDL